MGVTLPAQDGERILNWCFIPDVVEQRVLARCRDASHEVREAREAAEKDGQSGWKFTLHMPSYLPVMQYADSRRLRAQMYRAYATRASEFGPAELDNTPLIGHILRLRREALR